MGKITDVYYTEVDRKKEEAGEYYFYHNLLSVDPFFHQKYEELERQQIDLRNMLIRKAIVNRVIPEHTMHNNAILGISPLRNRTVLIIEY